MRIVYAADVHGNDKTWRKFVNVPKYVKNIDVMMMGGDLTGKMLIPIFKRRMVMEGTGLEILANEDLKKVFLGKK